MPGLCGASDLVPNMCTVKVLDCMATQSENLAMSCILELRRCRVFAEPRTWCPT